MAAPGRTHEQELAASRQSHEQRAALLQQFARLFLIISLTAAWLGQALYVTYHAVGNPLILEDVEKFIALIAITGGLVATLVVKLWPEAKE